MKTKNVSWPPLEDPGKGTFFFTMGTLAELQHWYINMSEIQYNGGIGYDWNNDVIIKEMTMPNTCGGYGAEVCDPTKQWLSMPHLFVTNLE